MSLNDDKSFTLATLSIGMICEASQNSIYSAKKQLLNLITQINDDTEISSFIIYVGIATYQENDLKKIKEYFEEEKVLKNVFINLFFAPKDVVQSHVTQQHADPAFRLHHHDFVEKRTQFNILVSLLFWYCSQQSEYMLFTDETVLPQNNTMKNVEKLLKVLLENPNHLEVVLSPVQIFARLYNSRHLERYATFIYWTSVYSSIYGIMGKFKYLTLSLEKMQPPDFLFLLNSLYRESNHKNPSATLSTNMKTHGDYSFDILYHSGGVFWSPSNLKSSYLTIKFNYMVTMKRILIKTCLTKMMNDCLTNAVLEYSNDTECAMFELLSDFRKSEIDIDVFSSQRTVCLRIRLLSSDTDWVAIRELKIFTSDDAL